jgi:hypothetical protein
MFLAIDSAKQIYDDSNDAEKENIEKPDYIYICCLP